MPRPPFSERLKGAPILCDGAMGTLLYSKGIFINRCYDELNLSQPDLIRGIHQDYLQAGAEVIETNTFGANSFRLARHGLGDRVREINVAGAQLARGLVTKKESGKTFYVAGSVGPLGVRIEPLGKTSLAEAREAFRAQIAALVEGGVDLIFLETFGALEEIHQAIQAARDVDPKVPVLAMVTIDEDGNCLDGASPETFGAKLTDWGADVAGCNCSVGPVAMLDAIERVRKVTPLPVIAQPNAGMPRSVEGRNIYLCSPEYMASYTRKFIQAGAQVVGGCCGTTPEHIRAMRAALRAGEARGAGFQVVTKPAAQHEIETPLLEKRSRLGSRLASGEFITMVEIVPPKGTDATKEIEGARYLKSVGIDVINIPDSPRASARMSNQALAIILQQQVGVETILHYTCRDRNVLSIQSDLLGAAAIGLRNILCVTGDPPKLGNYPDATAVFDVDAIGLVNIVHNLNRGLDIGGNAIGTKGTGFVVAVGANPGVPNLDEEIRRFEYKVEAGAEMAITQPVFDVGLLENFLRRIEHCRIPVIAGIWPLVSMRNAEFMKNELRVSVPDSVLQRMAAAPNPEAARAEGVALAREMLEAVRDVVQGAQISAPNGRYTSAVDVLEALGSTRGASV